MFRCLLTSPSQIVSSGLSLGFLSPPHGSNPRLLSATPSILGLVWQPRLHHHQWSLSFSDCADLSCSLWPLHAFKNQKITCVALNHYHVWLPASHAATASSGPAYWPRGNTPRTLPLSYAAAFLSPRVLWFQLTSINRLTKPSLYFCDLVLIFIPTDHSFSDTIDS